MNKNVSTLKTSKILIMVMLCKQLGWQKYDQGPGV